MSALRATLKSDLEALLPNFKVTRGIKTPDQVTKPLVILEQKSLEPSTSARGWLDIGLSVHVVTHYQGMTDKAEDEVDALVLEVMAALEQIRYLTLGAATKKMYAETNLSYEIETTNTARKKVSP
ncbi:MAG: hypothetical protein LCH36_00325 [Actinobacteria bacterium]|nr:hypothetical protein [Actinomycetota bacterium]